MKEKLKLLLIKHFCDNPNQRYFMRAFKIIMFYSIILGNTNLMIAQSLDSSPYCAGSGFASGTTNNVVNFSVGTFSNSTISTSPLGYNFYNNLPYIELEKNNDYPMSIAFTGLSLHYIGVFIDFNHDLDFDDENELVFNSYQSYLPANFGSSPINSNLLIPGSALGGETRLRVVAFEDDNYTFSNYPTLPNFPWSCVPSAENQFQIGEVEDYRVNISNPLEVESIESLKDVLLYQNDDKLIFKFPEGLIADQRFELQLFNIDGQSLDRFEIIQNEGYYKTDLLKKGVYFLVINDSKSNGEFVRKKFYFQ